MIQANQAALALIGGEIGAVLNKPFWETPWWSYDETSREKSMTQSYGQNLARPSGLRQFTKTLKVRFILLIL